MEGGIHSTHNLHTILESGNDVSVPCEKTAFQLSVRFVVVRICVNISAISEEGKSL